MTARRGLAHAALILGLLLTLLGGPASAQARAPMRTGFVDDPLFFQSPDSVRSPWLAQAQNIGSSIIRLPVYWSFVAPSTRAPGFHPTNPADQQYDFADIDSAVKAATAHHQAVLLTVREAPVWAEQHLPPHFQYHGAWDPSPTAFGQFARAVALRYSGHFRDPASAHNLPAVRYLQAWNEPNLPSYLSPQWGRSRSGRIVPLSPGIYRDLLNAFYANVKAVAPNDQVLAAGTAPYGDAPATGQQRMHPVTFLQSMFCLTANLSSLPCPSPPHLDALDHHPYSLSPITQARNPADVSVADLGRINRVLAGAQRAHHVIPAGPKPLWTTEIDWSDVPPENLDKQARALSEAFYELWSEGVSVVLWFQLRDPPAETNSFVGSGLYFVSGKAKPAAAAYRFPFCAVPSHGAWTVWGRAPAAGRVKIQRESGRTWKTIATLRSGAGNYFSTRGHLVSPHQSLRAVIGHSTSLVWQTSGPY